MGSVRQKKGLIPALLLIFTLPLATLLYVEIRAIRGFIEFTRNELIGVEYNRSLRGLLEQLMYHRGVSSAYLNGDPSFKSRLGKAHSIIEEKIGAVELIDKKHGTLLRTDPMWGEIKKKWKDLKDKELTLSPEENFNSHSGLIADVITLIGHVGETSNLVLNSEMDTYYLMDSTTFQFPYLLENLGQARGFGVRVLERQRISDVEKMNSHVLSALIKGSYEEARKGLQKVFATNAELKDELGPEAERFHRHIDEFLNIFESRIINAADATLTPADYYETATRVIDAGFSLYDKQVPVIERLLRDRIDRNASQQSLIMAVSAVITAIFVYVITLLTKNLTDLEAVDKNLRNQVEFEKFIASISTTLLNSSSRGVNDAASRVLEKVGLFVGADTCYVSLLSGDGLAIDSMDEWCGEGISPLKESYVGLPVEKIPWLFGSLRNAEVINIPKVGDLPEEAVNEKALLQAAGVRSVLLAPLIFNNRTSGFLGLNCIREERSWIDRDILLLKIVGEIVVNTLERQKMQQFLKDSREYIQMILNSQEGILIITDGKKIRYANKSFLDFFGYVYLEDFLQEHNCICDMFAKEEGLISKERDGCPEVIFSEAGEKYKVKMLDRRNGQMRFFLANPNKLPGEKEQAVVSFIDITDIENESRRLEYLSITDPLTKIFNRLKFDSVLDFQISMARRYQKSFSVIMFDIDHFKEINDTLGHKVGDETLKRLVQIISSNLRASDIFARWGGEEFVVLLPETELGGAFDLAEDLRKRVESGDFGVAGRVTCSFGVVSFFANDNADTLMKRVDDAMYVAKKAGRNVVCKR